jgi:hypothetical protein
MQPQGELGEPKNSPLDRFIVDGVEHVVTARWLRMSGLWILPAKQCKQVVPDVAVEHLTSIDVHYVDLPRESSVFGLLDSESNSPVILHVPATQEGAEVSA